MLGRTQRIRHLAPLLLLLLALFLALHAALPASGLPRVGRRPTGRRAYVPPIVAPVTDPFRPPANPYGPGNRGIDYATVPGTVVVAAADGVVTFAGPVAGALHVTIQHADGIRTSYSFLAAILVAAGQRVAQGAPIGLTGSSLHVGARIGDTYIDPAALWSGPPHVALVPLGGAGPVADGARFWWVAGRRYAGSPAPHLRGADRPTRPGSNPGRLSRRRTRASPNRGKEPS